MRSLLLQEESRRKDPHKGICRNVTSKAFLLLWRIHADLVAGPQTPGSGCRKRGATQEDVHRRNAGVERR